MWLFFLLFSYFIWSSYSEAMIATCTFPPFQNDTPACGHGLKCCPGFHCHEGACVSIQKGSASEFALMAHAMSMSADAIVDEIVSKITTVSTSIIRADTFLRDEKSPSEVDPLRPDLLANDVLKTLNISADVYVDEVESMIKQRLDRLNRMEKEYKAFVLESQTLIQRLIKEKRDKVANIGNSYEPKLLLPERVDRSVEQFARSYETYLDRKEQSFRIALASKLENLDTFISRETPKISYMDGAASCNSNMDESLCIGNSANSLAQSTASKAENAAIRLLSAAAYLRKSADSLVLLNGLNTTDDVPDTKHLSSDLRIPSGEARMQSFIHSKESAATDFSIAVITIFSLIFAACVFWNLMTRCRSTRTGYETI